MRKRSYHNLYGGYRRRQREARELLRTAPRGPLRAALRAAGGELRLDQNTRRRLARNGLTGIELQAALISLDRMGEITLSNVGETIVVRLRVGADEVQP